VTAPFRGLAGEANGRWTNTARDLAGYGIPAGPCGGASLAGARAALTGEGAAARRASLAIRPDATVVLLSTEGSAANPVPAG
jgi:diaminopropionate ammonia-lyase